MAEARGTDRSALLEDRHMWRLLLARLHPDAGGDHELFLFACALKEEACDGLTPPGKTVHDHGERGTRRAAEPFLRTWQGAMSRWATRNREALKSSSP